MKRPYRYGGGVGPVLSALLCLGSLELALAQGPASQGIIEGCQYTTDAAAQAAWRPMRGSLPVVMDKVQGKRVLRFRCDFATNKIERASWDRAVKLDLSSSPVLELKLLCRDASPVSYFSLYFQSGEGWYHGTFFPESATDWNTITINRKEMTVEGHPAGWSQIRTIRLSAWRMKDVSTEFYVGELRAIDAATLTSPRYQAERAIVQIGQVGSFTTFELATNRIAQLKGGDRAVAAALASAASLRTKALELAAQGKFKDAQAQATAAHEQLTIAFCKAQRPLPGEFRAFWCHSAFGVQGMTWDEAIRRLAENGFTAILPNMLWGGAAFYDSKVLPVAAAVAERGDQLRQCITACRKYGLQVHVWKVDWNLGRATPNGFVERMRQEGRLQVNSRGEEERWLCPSHPENQKLEIDAMLELARNYDIDGLHFDYIRYPDSDHCFCSGCKERFQRQCHVTVNHWPADVLSGGPLRQAWLDWRRSNITTVVKAVSEQARAIKPKLKISAAVFRYWNTDRDSVGQDWKVWCDKGYLDFVCPMDYTPSNNRFENMVSQQVQWAGRVPCYPGIGVSASSSRFGADRAIDQINITRRYKTGGFIIFNYGVKESGELLPLLGMGITARDGAPLK